MTSILNRYIIRAVLGTTLLVMLVLLTLSGLYIFITQQDEIGVGTYTLEDAFLYVGLNLPKYAFDMLPIAALIGALLALGNMARSMELIVVRAAGVSVARIAMWVAGAGVILMLLTGILGELVAPQMEQYGRRMKTFEKYRDYSLAGNRSAWAKDADTIVSVGQQSGDNRYGGVYVFNFDPQHRLRSIGRASSASIDPDNVWRLENYRESRFDEERVVPRGPSAAQVRTRLSTVGRVPGARSARPGIAARGRPAQLHSSPEGKRSRLASVRNGVLGAHRTHCGRRHHRRAGSAVRVRADALDRHRLAHRRRYHDRRGVLPAREDAGERRCGVRSATCRDRLVSDGPVGTHHWHCSQSRAMTAGVLRRLGAMLYDLLIVVALMFIVTALFLPLTGGVAITPGDSGALERIYQAALLLVLVLFFCVFWTWRGQTIGMLAWRLRVERSDGSSLTWRDALLRLAGACVSIAALGCGYWWIWIDRERLAWHDRWSRTRVVVLPKGNS
jgi:uncharacterized RDD family membrane protein YckC